MDKFIGICVERFQPIFKLICFFYERLMNYHRVSSWFDMASGTSYYFLLGFIPFLVFLVNIVLFVMASQLNEFYDIVNFYLPSRVAVVINADVSHMVGSRNTLWMWVAGLMAMYSFVQGIENLIRAADSLDFSLAKKMTDNRQETLRVHIKGVVFTIGLMIVILASLGIPVFGNAIVELISASIALPEAFMTFWDILRFIVPFVVLIIWLTFFYICAPHHYTPTFKNAGLTAMLVTCLWLLATAIYSWCLSVIPTMGIAYGPLFGLFVLFIWFKFIAMAIIFGIEFLLALAELDLRNLAEEVKAKPLPMEQ